MPGTTPFRLSKSKVIAGNQCLKRLWLQIHQPDAATDTGNAMALAIGHEVGAAAQGLYPGGTLLGSHEDLRASLAATADWAGGKGPSVVFEATFQADDVLVMADIIERRRNRLHVIEVKASTSVKDYHRDDVAVQAHVLSRAGHRPASVQVRVIDNRFIYKGDGDYRGLFVDTDLSDEALGRGREVAGWLKAQQQALAGGEPDIAMGEQCNQPYACEFQDYCRALRGWKDADYPVEILPRGSALAAELRAEGYADLREIPAARLGTNTTWLRVREASRSGRAFLDPTAAAQLAECTGTRYYLDFEGINPAVPRWAGTRPYQQLPFQWSLHIERPDGSLEQRGFLHTGAGAPMRPAMEQLIRDIGRRGTVFVYNRAYEGRVLRDMAVMFPDLADRLLAIEKRFVDLLDIARRHYYHPAMLGSWSIKAVLPTIAPELDYSTLGEVQDGGGAQVAYLEIIDPATPAARRAQLIEDLTRYCAQDTLAMVKLVEAFSKPVRARRRRA
jgi:hypothetical protein